LNSQELLILPLLKDINIPKKGGFAEAKTKRSFGKILSIEQE